MVIKGELNGSEDLTVEGNVEGKIELREHVLTIGPHGKIKAEVFAKVVIVLGEVVGNINAAEKVDIRDNGSVDGDIVSPRVAIAEGAHFRGSVDMQKKPAAPAQAAKPGTSTILQIVLANDGEFDVLQAAVVRAGLAGPDTRVGSKSVQPINATLVNKAGTIRRSAIPVFMSSLQSVITRRR